MQRRKRHSTPASLLLQAIPINILLLLRRTACRRSSTPGPTADLLTAAAACVFLTTSHRRRPHHTRLYPSIPIPSYAASSSPVTCFRPAWRADCCLLRDTRNTSRAESTGTVDREWIAGETPLLHTRWPISFATRHLTSSRTPAAAALLSTPPRNTAHHPPPPCPTRATTAAAVPVRRAAAPTRACRIIPTQYAVPLPPLLAARDSVCRPAGPSALISPIYRPQCDLSRLRAALCPYTAVALSPLAYY